MFGSVVLEVAIGLAYLYLLLSVVCSAINEWLAGALQLRAGTLKAALTRLLAPETVDTIYQNGLVQNLTGTSRPPSYIPSRVFATALLDACNLAGTVTSATTIQELQQRITNIQNEKVRSY